jgi:hypothetical protein
MEKLNRGFSFGNSSKSKELIFYCTRDLDPYLEKISDNRNRIDPGLMN